MMQKMISRKRLAAFFALIVLGSGSVYGITRLVNRNNVDSGSGISLDKPLKQPLAAAGESVDTGAARLDYRLSKGQQQLGSAEPAPVITGDPLTAGEIEQIINRLPALSIDTEAMQDFRLPESPLPPPRTGETIQETFPPTDTRPVPETGAGAGDAGPLSVLRYSPEGEIPLAPFLNVTFDQPMVPLATVESLAAVDVPVKLTPALPGIWRWAGTKTLTFEYKGDDPLDRFPMATDYTAEIPAGTTSANGGVLASAVRWSFSTPPPKMISYYPSDSLQLRDPLMFIAFDQMIDAAAILSRIELTAGSQQFSLRLASADEIAADVQISRQSKGYAEGRWLAFRANDLLPAGANVQVTLAAGAPSAEGPLTTEEEQIFGFSTYAPLRIESHRCGWYDGECPPMTPFEISFNNPIDVEAYDQSMLQVDPDIPGVRVSINGSQITIQGLTKGKTTYRVRVDSSIKDIFGQTLGRDESLTFKVGSAPQALTGPNQNLVTLDPSATKPVFTVYSINYDKLRVRVYQVKPEDWPAYLTYRDNFYRQEQAPTPPGREVINKNISIDSAADSLTETAIDLSDALDRDFGHLIVVVDPPPGLLDRVRGQRPEMVQAWVQVTQIGLDAFVDHSQMIIWANDLADGQPLAAVPIQLLPASSQVSTGADGIAKVPLSYGGISMLIATQGDDTAILPSNTYSWERSIWQQRSVSDELRWHVFDDRQMYKPGEEVHVKGWLRRVGGKQDGDVTLISGSAPRISYRVIGSQGNDIFTGSATANALGGFDLNFTLPTNANLGYAQLILNARGVGGNIAGTEYYYSFQIQEFRRPEFEVSARSETTGPYFAGDFATLAVSAQYFAGGPLANADVTWDVSSSPSSYSPPNWSDFIFGTWTPWWYLYDYGYSEYSFDPYRPYDQGDYETFQGITDSNGEDFLRLDFDTLEGAKPFSILADATVMDVNRQAWTASTSLLVHPSSLYVGLRSERTFVQRGTPLEIETIVTDLDGSPIAGRPVLLQAARLEWQLVEGSWTEVEVDIQECTIQSGEEPVSCTFTTELGGQYRITAQVTDSEGRLNQSQFTRWVSGGKQPPARKVERETVTLIPSKESYQPGDTAEILVQAPFSPAEGLLTVSRSGILYTERFSMAEDTYTLRIPVSDAYIPNLSIQVDLAGAAPRTDDQGEIVEGLPDRPAYASGNLELNIPPMTRALSLDITPAQPRLEPGGQTTIDVTLTDAAGQPVSGAELAVVVVDEAILALTNYQLADPLSTFYTSRPAYLSATYGRETIVLANPELLSEQMKANVEVQSTAGARMVAESEMPMEEMAFAEPAMMDMAAAPAEMAGAEPIKVRSNFNPLATFAPEVRTDGSGKAQIEVQLPDNLTRYRIMVVAVAGDNKFGAAESNLTARLPLMVRPSAPRFLNFGDSLEIPVVIQNQTDDDMTVDVVLEAHNIILTAGAGQRVQVPANDRIEVRFPATTNSAGDAYLRFAAVSGSYADAASITLPVYTPATTEAFATYGVIDDGAIAQPVSAPENVFSQFGGLEISTSSTALQALTDAVLYLSTYPYDCSEQLASRIMAIASLRDVLTAFSADGLPSPEELVASVGRDIDRLQGLQNNDGGFPIWVRGKESVPYYTIHVAHALQRAELKGFQIPSDMKSYALDYLRQIESYYPDYYGKQTRQSLSAYALYVRQLMGDPDPAKARRLFQEAGLEDLSLEAVAWLWPVMANDSASTSQVAAISRHFNNRAVETANAANFTTSYGDEAYLMLHSNRRTDGIILEALIANQPDSDLIPKVVNGLLAHRTRGRWGNTQENAFILLALDSYFNTFESETPEFVARIWLGDTYAGDHAFVGRTTERHQTDIPMSYLTDAGAEMQNLILSKEGPGRLYYRLGLSYAPTDLGLDPLDMGFTVQRVYEAVDDPEDVTQDDQGVWHIRAGARVRVRLTMVAENRRYNVALVDPLPAGLEIVNAALAVSSAPPSDPTPQPLRYGWWWRLNWYDHQNMRDERAEAFTTLLWEGVYDYSYIARATTPGEFVVPPAKAEEMYTPEVFGRSGSDRVIIK